MKKLTIFILLFATALSAEFNINQNLQDTLRVRAKENIKNLPQEMKNIYKSYLDEYDDGLMAYLISTEKSGALWDTNPKNIEDNYLMLKKLFILEDYDKYLDKFVLSYIAKTTNSHEIITNYRKVFADIGLLDYVEKYPDLKERLRMITLWTREHMTFVSTSGRTQDPISILQKSNIGRCGEMQVFYIAALRTVGIPARPAWTPWWAHTDNNHAWTEIFIDGAWHYAENTSPTYNLDNAWFSASSKKALLILARSSFPDSTDDVVSKGRNNNYVNSTHYYQDTRKITVKLVDENNQPIENGRVSISAFNFAKFRPLLTLKADSLGISSFTVGKGGFLMVAYQDSLFDYKLIPFDDKSPSKTYTLVLQEQKWQDFDFTLEYPKGSAENKEEPEDFVKLKQNSEDKYDKLNKSFDEKPIPEFAPNDSLFVEVFKKCRNNKQPLLDFVQKQNNIPSEFWEKLLEIDKKFLWAANSKQFANIYVVYNKLIEENISKDDFNNLLSPSVFYEILPQNAIPEIYIFDDIHEPKKKIYQIVDYLHSKHDIDEEKAVNGLLSLDKMVEANYLQDFHFKTLSCYAFQANMIPVKYTRIPSVVTVKTDSIWQNYNVVKNDFTKSQENGETSQISVEFTLVDESGEPVTINSDNISITFFQEGKFYFNDRQLEYNKEESKLTGDLDKGDYQLQICIRESGEITKTKLVSLNLDKQMKLEQTLIFKDFKRDWKNADKTYYEFLSSFTDKNSDWVLLLGNYNLEPPQRLATKIRAKLEEQKFIWIGDKKPISDIANYISSEKYNEFMENN
ncbi:MAG: transglutaminase-like domain-containing protein, partial [Candidatus Cloacimonadota bacterium]|nr:transglutaminase-like domain-containing protein [Candidatus Cloacimonadota bacterium]